MWTTLVGPSFLLPDELFRSVLPLPLPSSANASQGGTEVVAAESYDARPPTFPGRFTLGSIKWVGGEVEMPPAHASYVL